MRTFALSILVLALAGGWARTEEDVDPEPQTGGLSQLRGKWVVSRMIFSGKDGKTSAGSYTFEGNKVTVQSGKLTYTATVKIDTRKKPATLELIRDELKSTRTMPFKVENGELFLAIPAFKGGDGNPKAEDFSGESRPVMVLTREKK